VFCGHQFASFERFNLGYHFLMGQTDVAKCNFAARHLHLSHLSGSRRQCSQASQVSRRILTVTRSASGAPATIHFAPSLIACGACFMWSIRCSIVLMNIMDKQRDRGDKQKPEAGSYGAQRNKHTQLAPRLRLAEFRKLNQ